MEAKPATNNNAMRMGAPDSDSHSVEREGAQSCRKRRRSMGRSCCRSRTPSFADRVAAAPVPSGCSKMRCLRRARRSVELGTCDREGERWSAQPQSGEPRPAPLHSFAGATLRGPSSAS